MIRNSKVEWYIYVGFFGIIFFFVFSGCFWFSVLIVEILNLYFFFLISFGIIKDVVLILRLVILIYDFWWLLYFFSRYFVIVVLLLDVGGCYDNVIEFFVMFLVDKGLVGFDGFFLKYMKSVFY